MNLRTILVPTDLSQASQPAVDAAAKLARLAGANLTLLHVIDMVYYDYGWMYEGIPVPQDLLVKRESEVADQMLHLLTPEQKEGINVRTHVVFGQPFQAILDIADEKNADLIVMGTHGRRGLSHLFLGSVAEKIVRLATCPVLTIRTSEEKIQTESANATTAAQ